MSVLTRRGVEVEGLDQRSRAVLGLAAQAGLAAAPRLGAERAEALVPRSPRRSVLRAALLAAMARRCAGGGAEAAARRFE